MELSNFPQDERVKDFIECLVDGVPGKLFTHRPELCTGRQCSVHNPSKHGLSDCPLNWRSDRGLMERVCEHGVGHPDPDHLYYVRITHGEKWERVGAVHGCCGCCQ
jgi:hypothetical protein